MSPREPIYIPEPTQPGPTAHVKLVLWLIVAGLTILSLPIYLTGTLIQDEIQTVENSINFMRRSSTDDPVSPVSDTELNRKLEEIQEQFRQVEAVPTAIAEGHIDWAPILFTISNYDVEQMQVTGLVQSNDQILISGQAGSDLIASAYAQALGASNQFGDVAVQTITPIMSAAAKPESEESGKGPVEFSVAVTVKAEAP